MTTRRSPTLEEVELIRPHYIETSSPLMAFDLLGFTREHHRLTKVNVNLPWGSVRLMAYLYYQM